MKDFSRFFLCVYQSQNPIYHRVFFSTLFILVCSINSMLHRAFVYLALLWVMVLFMSMLVLRCSVSWKNSGALGNVSSVCENRNSIKKTQPPTIISKLDGRLEQYNHAIEVNYLHMHLYNVSFIVKPLNAPARLHAAAFAWIYLHTLLLSPHPVLTFTCSDVYRSDLIAVVLSDTLHVQALPLFVMLTHSNIFVFSGFCFPAT